MKIQKPDFEQLINGDRSRDEAAPSEPHPLDNVVAPSMGGSILTITAVRLTSKAPLASPCAVEG